MDFKAELNSRVKDIETIIGRFLPAEEGYNRTVAEAMNYSVQAGGKRLRPMLMQETFRMFGGEGTDIEYFMAALEMIHTYSLVHDDLECMDNDEYRRGKKTTHAVYGEGMAVLAGDGLLNYAMETAAGAFNTTKNPESVGRALQVMFTKSGIYGMIGGQTADIEAEEMDQKLVDGERLLYIHEHKTAALIEAALMVGAILAGADTADIDKLEKIGYNVGIAFQIQDDILDVTSTLEELGKPIGSDEKNGKMTYVSLYGMEKSQADVKQLSEEAVELLHSMKCSNQFLEELLLSLIGRTK